MILANGWHLHCEMHRRRVMREQPGPSPPGIKPPSNRPLPAKTPSRQRAAEYRRQALNAGLLPFRKRSASCPCLCRFAVPRFVRRSRKKGLMDTLLAIRARGVTKCFGNVVALDGIDLDVAQGQIHGLVGPNGAGKTTLLGLLLGLAVADSGRLEILGTPVGRALAAPDSVAGFVDGPGLYPSLTARQNLAALVALRGRDAQTIRIDDVLD